MSEEKSISAAELVSILAEQQRKSDERMLQLIEAMKKPSVMEQRALDKEQAEVLAKNEERKENAAGMKAKRDADRMTKRTCHHQHPKGDTHCVWIQEKTGPGYILCQMNQCVIRPEPAPKVSHGRGPDGKQIWVDYDGDDIYDTNEFNRLWQTLPSNELFQ
jgi:hypothetical protein